MKNKKEITIVIALATVPLSGSFCGDDTNAPTTPHEKVDAGATDAEPRDATLASDVHTNDATELDGSELDAQAKDADVADVPRGPRVFFVSPTNGETVGMRTTFQFGVEGFELIPAHVPSHAGQGHLHVMIDLPCVVVGATIARGLEQIADLTEGQDRVAMFLPAGAHDLCLQAATSTHSALGLTDEISIVVE